MPIGAYVPVGDRAEGGCRPGAAALHEYIIARWGDGIGSFGCYNPASRAGDGWSLHREGRAIDVSVSPNVKDKGDEIFQWTIANADALGLQEIQWHGQIWTSRRSQEGIRTDTSGAAKLHYDHLHIGLASGYEFTPPDGSPPPPPQQEDDLTPEQDARLSNVEKLLSDLQNAISDPERGVLATTYKNNERLGEIREKVNALYNYVVKNQFGVTVSSVTNETLRMVNKIFAQVKGEGD